MKIFCLLVLFLGIWGVGWGQVTANCVARDTVYLDINGNAAISWSDIDSLSEPSGFLSYSLNVTNFACYNVGPLNVVILSVDSGGVTDTCWSRILVYDAFAPVAICNNYTVSLDSLGTGSVNFSNIDAGSFDACGIASRSIDLSSFSAINIPSTVVTLLVTDNNGNDATCASHVTVEDNIPPALVVKPNLTVYYEGGIDSIVLSPEDLVLSSSDNCPGAQYAPLSQATFSYPTHLGPFPVSVTIFDIGGNISTASSMITVNGDCRGYANFCSDCYSFDHNDPNDVSRVFTRHLVPCSTSQISNASNIFKLYEKKVNSGKGITSIHQSLTNPCPGHSPESCTSVTDQFGCPIMEYYMVIHDSCDTTTNRIASGGSSCNVCSVSCNGANDGSTHISVIGGTPNYTFAWSNGDTFQNIDSLAPGTYTVTVTDANGLTAVQSVTITQPAPLIVTTTATNTCLGQSTGSIQATVTGGCTNYTYLWSNGATTATASNLAAGAYTVTVTDGNGCTATQTQTVGTFAAVLPIPTYVATVISVPGVYTTYQWLIGGIPISGAIGNTFAPQLGGTYSVQVMDNFACTFQSPGITIACPRDTILLHTGNGYIPNARDPNWFLVDSVSIPAFINNPNPNWSSAQPPQWNWIGNSMLASGNSGSAPGTYVYQRNFNIAVVDTSIRLHIKYLTDDTATLDLNGNVVKANYANYITPFDTTISGPFSNANVLTSTVVNNGTQNGGPTPHGNAVFALLSACRGFLVDVYDPADNSNPFADVTLYPNPTDGTFHVAQLPPNIKVQFIVVNLAGQVLLESSSPDIDVRALPAGIYLLRMRSRSGLEAGKRFIKE